MSYRVYEEVNGRAVDVAHIPKEWSGDGGNARLIEGAPDLYRLLHAALYGHFDQVEALRVIARIDGRE